MLANTLRTRGVVFAHLFGPPRFVRREEASSVHDRVCSRLRNDDIAFQYRTTAPQEKPSTKGFIVELSRKEGRGGFGLKIDFPGADGPMRLLMTHEWPASLQHVVETFDMASEAAFEALEGNWSKVLAEVRIRAQCEVREGEGIAFLKDRIFRPGVDDSSGLGTDLVFASARFDVAASTSPQTSLDGPKREVHIEVLKEDPRGLYLELVSQWLQFPAQTPSEGDLTRPRPIDQSPSSYVEEADAYLRDRVLALGSEGQ